MNTSTSFYERISQFSWPASYSGKILLVAFIGTHIPLITLVIFLTYFYPIEYRFVILFCVLIATLGGTLGTLYYIYKLLSPIRLTKLALQEYRDEKKVPSLPKHFADDAGQLMAQTQYCIEELDRLLKLKNHLISTISHDSKTPLGAITLALGMIEIELNEENIDRKEVEDYLEMIEVSTRSHRDFLNSMLSLARFDEANLFDEGELIVHREWVSAASLFEKLQKNHKLYISKKNLQVQTNIELDQEDQLYIDLEKVMSVLNNIMQNAIKFTNRGGSINLSIAKDGDTHIIEVEDSGIGIPKEKQDELFKAFSSSRSGTDKEKGTGLGLWIAKLFTELHGGTISISSKGKEQGTKVTITLPIKHD